MILRKNQENPLKASVAAVERMIKSFYFPAPSFAHPDFISRWETGIWRFPWLPLWGRQERSGAEGVSWVWRNGLPEIETQSLSTYSTPDHLAALGRLSPRGRQGCFGKRKSLISEK